MSEVDYSEMIDQTAEKIQTIFNRKTLKLVAAQTQPFREMLANLIVDKVGEDVSQESFDSLNRSIIAKWLEKE